MYDERRCITRWFVNDDEDLFLTNSAHSRSPSSAYFSVILFPRRGFDRLKFASRKVVSGQPKQGRRKREIQRIRRILIAKAIANARDPFLTDGTRCTTCISFPMFDGNSWALAISYHAWICGNIFLLKPCILSWLTVRDQRIAE